MRKWIIAGIVAVVLIASIVPVYASPVRGKPVFVQHPYTARQRMKVGVEFRTWGYVAPKVSDLSSRTVEILIYRQTGPRSWVATDSVSATMFNRARFRNRTMYEAKVTLSVPGRYRMRAKYTWKLPDGTLKSRLSSYKYFRIVKK